MSKVSVEIVKRSLDAYNRRDFDAIRAVSDPNLEVDWSASRGLQAGVYRGVEEVVSFYRTFLDTFEKVEIEAERFIESGASVVVPNTAHLRGRDGIATVARSALVFEVRGERIARIRLYQETQEALEAVGLSG
jgi:ketosteroid isomerase-like protein